VIAALEVAYKRDERLLRFLTVSLDKYAVAYNEKKRNAKKAAEAEAPAAPAAVAEEEK
jgi:small subunit ribosomal protein S6